MLYSWLQSYNNFIAETFSVNPIIFITIYLIATPTYYFGLYKVGKEAINHVRINKKLKKSINLHQLFLEKGFLEGYTLNRVSWAAPYFYVFYSGKNIPFRYYVLIISWFLVSLYIFTHNLNKKYLRK